MSKKSEIFEFIKNFMFENDGEFPTTTEILDEVGHNYISYKYANKLLNDYKETDYDIPTQGNEDEEADSKNYKKFEGEKIYKKFGDDDAEINVNSLTIHTLDQALEVSKVDLEKWEVDRYVVNSWQVTMKNKFTQRPKVRTNYQVKVWLKAKKADVKENIIQELIKTLPKIKVNHKIKPKFSNDEFAGEMALYDVHYGKLAYNAETGGGDQDIEIINQIVLDGCEKGLSHLIPYKPSKIFYVLGNDFMHSDNKFNKTPIGGNQLDVIGHYTRNLRKAFECIVETINMCRSVAPVEIKWIPGNHDIHTSFFLAMMAHEHYSQDRWVNVDASDNWRKAVLWGNLLVGWAHDATGRKQGPSINMLPQWWPELWGQSKYRELHVGHHHKKLLIKTMPVNTVGGTIIRQIPSPSFVDRWHSENLFIDAVPACESLLWSKKEGVVAHFTSNVEPKNSK